MMGKPKRAALYVRVSTDHQSVENQVRELKQVAERRGWTVIAATPASMVPRDATSGLASMPCSRMPAGASLTL
jgi:hypothetical protein